MNSSSLELADILRAYGPAYLQAYGDKLFLFTVPRTYVRA